MSEIIFCSISLGILGKLFKEDLINSFTVKMDVNPNTTRSEITFYETICHWRKLGFNLSSVVKLCKRNDTLKHYTDIGKLNPNKQKM